MRQLLIDILGDNYDKINRIHAEGRIWYKAHDVCKVFGLKNTTVAVKGNPRIGYFGIDCQDIYGERPTKNYPLYISEAGMFKLILKSRKPAAHIIKAYLSENVLPMIMLDGSFAVRAADSYHENGISVQEVKRRRRMKKRLV